MGVDEGNILSIVMGVEQCILKSGSCGIKIK